MLERQTMAACRGCALPCALACALLGCAGVRPTLPEVVIGATYSRRAKTTVAGTGRRGEALTLRVSLRVPTSLPPSPAEPLSESRAEAVAAPCLSPRLCAWERESRHRALRRLIRRLGIFDPRAQEDP